jgi:PIN domain nuclease of toxin-antitoxin system
MTLLLDTHALLWFLSNSPKLSTNGKATIEAADEVFVSIASLWEIAIKVGLKKLDLPQPFDEFVEGQLAMNDIMVLDISIVHLKALPNLPRHHGDPFDRLLIAQALIEKIPLVSADAAFDAYDMTRIW